MDIENYSDETISYIYGELNKQEEADFEKSLKSDPVLAKEVRQLKHFMNVIKTGIQLEKYINDPGRKDL